MEEKLLIISSLKEEILMLIKYYKPEIIYEIGRNFLYRKKIGNIEIEFGITGVGSKNVKKFFEIYFRQNKKPSLLVSTGYAGAINPKLKVGNIVIASSFICNSDIYSFNKKNFLQEYFGIGLGVNKVIYKNEKKIIREKFKNVDFIDMESCEVIENCIRNNINFVIIRVISDNSNFNFPEPVFINKSFKKIFFTKLIFKLIKNPANIYKIIMLNFNLYKASKKLSRFLINFIKEWKSFL